MFKRVATFIYGVLCYLVFFGTFLYAIGFIGDVMAPKSIDSGRTAPLGEALLINAALLALFAVQHSTILADDDDRTPGVRDCDHRLHLPRHTV